MSGCNRTDPAEAAAVTKGAALAASLKTDLPSDCRKTEAAGIRAGDRLDTSLLRFDRALTAQNARTLRCAAWYDSL